MSYDMMIFTATDHSNCPISRYIHIFTSISTPSTILQIQPIISARGMPPLSSDNTGMTHEKQCLNHGREHGNPRPIVEVKGEKKEDRERRQKRQGREISEAKIERINKDRRKEQKGRQERKKRGREGRKRKGVSPLFILQFKHKTVPRAESVSEMQVVGG